MVTTPEVPPYSSTTMAIWVFFSLKVLNRSEQRLDSGTKIAGRMKEVMGCWDISSGVSLMQRSISLA